MSNLPEVGIEVEHVSKAFKLPHEKNSSVKSAVVNFYRHNRKYEKQQVLKDVSFSINQGEFFGIVGRNGSGKSTLLKMLAGIYSPDKGNIKVNGKLTPFIELGVGFNPELTGRENVYLNGALLGFNRLEMGAMYQDIVDFSELDKFMDQKLKNYSSGMQVRLAFAIAIRAESDILLLDEVLAVGDAIFQQKCFDYFNELKKNNKTVVFVSHDSGALLQYCDKGILIEKGEMVSSGPIKQIVNDYRDILNAHEAQEKEVVNTKKTLNRHGTREIEVIDAIVSDQPNGPAKKIFSDLDKTIYLKVRYQAKTEAKEPVFGITISDSAGHEVFASNTTWKRLKTPDLSNEDTYDVTWEVPNAFNTGTFSINPAVANSSGTLMYDWIDAYKEFKVRKALQSSAYLNIEHEVVINSVGSNKEV